MRQIILLACAVIQYSLVAPVLAAPVCSSQSLSDYIALGAGGCTVDGVTFNNFVEVAPLFSGATQITSSSVTLTPIAGSGGIGFALSSGASITADTSDLLELWFGFRAMGTGGLTGNTLLLGTPTVSGDGAITIVEDKCLDGTFSSPSSGCSGVLVTQIVFAIEGDSELQAAATFAAASFFDVFVDLVIDGGTNGSAQLGPQLSEVRVAGNGSTAVPEPPTIASLALALLALASLRIRQHRRV